MIDSNIKDVKTGIKLYIGIDILKKPWSISIFSAECGHIILRLPPDPQVLKKYIDDRFPHATVVCAYRATMNSSWIHRLFTSYDYQCLVFDPHEMSTLKNELSNNIWPRDSQAIAKALRYGLISSIFPQ